MKLLILICGLCILAAMGRMGHPGLAALRGWAYAHRGLHGNGVPENSMAAFRAALEGGYGIELDIHLTKDGDLAVIHDCSLKRTAGVDAKVTELTAVQLASYRLEGTQEPVPMFYQVLDLFAGKAPLIIELKADGNNAEQLVDTAVAAMIGYKGPWCMESFDPRCVFYLKKKYPKVIRGQLTEDYFANQNTLHPVIKFLLTHNLLNIFTQPDFVAYRFDHRNNSPLNFLWKKVWRLQGVAWTIRRREDFDTAVKEGWLPIFEGFRPNDARHPLLQD